MQSVSSKLNKIYKSKWQSNNLKWQSNFLTWLSNKVKMDLINKEHANPDIEGMMILKIRIYQHKKYNQHITRDIM